MPGILDDHEYQTPEPPAASASVNRRRLQPFIVSALALIVIAGAAYWMMRRTSEPSPPPAAPAPTTAPASPPGAPSTPVYDLPALDVSDQFIRDRAAELSSHPLTRAWARGVGLARNLVVVVENISRGLSPSSHLRALRPGGSFRTLQRGDRIVVDPRNYQRFTPIAEAAASIDPAVAARVYTGVKPLLQMAYDELGNQEPIDRAVERAVGQLLRAPVLDGDVPLQAAGEGIGYRFTSPAIESLPGVQKQLIRMGPANQRLIQARVREFARVAGLLTP